MSCSFAKSAISEIDLPERKSVGGKKPNKELEKDKYGKKKELEKKDKYDNRTIEILLDNNYIYEIQKGFHRRFLTLKSNLYPY